MKESLFDEGGAALISECGKYRYWLTRTWAEEGRRACFIMLNPSTADGEHDDTTIRKCIGFAKKWGCAGLIVVNLWAYRATDPKDLMASDAPMGPENRHHLKQAAYSSAPVVAAWGTHGAYKNMGMATAAHLAEYDVALQCLGVTKELHPKHPCRLAYATELIPWSPYPEVMKANMERISN